MRKAGFWAGCALFLLFAVPGGAEVPLRVWTSTSGSEVTARLVKFYPEEEVAMLKLELPGGKILTLRADQLAKADQDHLWKEYIHSYGARWVTMKEEPAPGAGEAEDHDSELTLEWHADPLMRLDLDFLHAPPEGVRLDRLSMPPNGDRSGLDSWGKRAMVSQIIWWTVNGMLESRHRNNAERLEKEVTRDVERSARGGAGSLASIATAMERYLRKRSPEAEALRALKLPHASVKDLSALAREHQMVLIEIEAYSGEEYEWTTETVLRTAEDDGKVSLLLWDAMTEGTLEPLPGAKPVQAHGPPRPTPYRLVIDSADRSENAEHLENENLEIRFYPGSARDPKVVVLSPKFRPKMAAEGQK